MCNNINKEVFVISYCDEDSMPVVTVFSYRNAALAYWAHCKFKECHKRVKFDVCPIYDNYICD